LGLKDIIRRITPPTLRRVTLSAMKQLFQPHPLQMDDPDCYVGTDEVSGELQFELLKREGCRPESKVLEIGCGNLHGAVPLIRYLEKGNYVGVDPNDWLRESAMKKRRIRSLVERKCARFLSVEDFDASVMGMSFDFVLSHSVLSHSAHWQLELFLRNVGKVLAPKGRILASIRLAEGNRFGSVGTPDREDSRQEEWQYPDVTWFKLSTVKETARALGLEAVHIEEYTEFYTQRRPKECHDWLVVQRTTPGPV
jgi:SAM-dependent methyltransferase